MTEYGMTEQEFREALRRQLLQIVRLFERRYRLPQEVDILVVPKSARPTAEADREPAAAS